MSFTSARRPSVVTRRLGNLLRCISTDRYLVPARGYLEISGKDAPKFLQGVCTNDINKLKKHGDCIAAAFLTPKGRVLADALLYYTQDSSEKVKYVVETNETVIAPLSSFLSTYKLRSKVKIANSFDYLTVLDRSAESDNSSVPENSDAIEFINAAIIRVEDPRIPHFGVRLLYNKSVAKESNNESNTPEKTPISLSKYGVERFCNGNSYSEYHRLRILNGLVEGTEIVNRIPLECNLDLMNYIDFAKGCYVGQELTARTKFKGMVRKRVLPFINSSELAQSNDGNPPFCTVETIQKKPVFVVGIDRNNVVAEGGVGTISLPTAKGVDDVDGAEGVDSKESYIGEVINVSPDGELCCALVRLEKVLPKIPGDKLQTFECQLTAAYFIGINNDRIRPVISIRPAFWVDKDPITNNRIDTHED